MYTIGYSTIDPAGLIDLLPFEIPSHDMNGLFSIAMAAAQIERNHYFLSPPLSDLPPTSSNVHVPIPSRPIGVGPRVVSDEKCPSPSPSDESEGVSLLEAHLEALLQETLLMAESLPAPPPAPAANETFANVNDDDVLCGRGGETNQ